MGWHMAAEQNPNEVKLPSLGKDCDTPPVKMKEIAAPVKSAVDKFQLLPEFLKVRGLVKQHIDSFNYFINEDMKKIIHTKGNEIVVSDVDPSFYVKYLDIRVEKPMRQLDYMVQELTPQICRLTDTTYAAPIKVDIEYTKASTKGNIDIERKKDVVIGYLPIMLRSCRCVLSGLDESELARKGECPLDPGGYFVVKGTEKETKDEKGVIVALTVKNPEYTTWREYGISLWWPT